MFVKIKKHLLCCLLCVSIYPSWGIPWSGYCASSPGGQFGFDTNSQHDCCTALKKSGRGISAQDDENCRHHWCGAGSKTEEFGHVKQSYCGLRIGRRVSDAEKKQCCRDVLYQYLNGELRGLNEYNKRTCRPYLVRPSASLD